jgi:hypothetical protein
LQPAAAEVTPKPGSWVEVARLRRAVTSAGFKPGAIHYTVTGTLTERRGQPALRVSGSDHLIALQASPDVPAVFDRARQLVVRGDSRQAEIEGQWMDGADAKVLGVAAMLRIHRLELAR